MKERKKPSVPDQITCPECYINQLILFICALLHWRPLFTCDKKLSLHNFSYSYLIFLNWKFFLPLLYNEIFTYPSYIHYAIFNINFTVEQYKNDKAFKLDPSKSKFTTLMRKPKLENDHCIPAVTCINYYLS